MDLRMKKAPLWEPKSGAAVASGLARAQSTMERRGFLKLFGVGATIVPLVAGMPKTDAAAKLVEVPKVNLEVAQSIPGTAPWFPMRPFINREKLFMQVCFMDADGNISTWNADTFLMSVERADVPNIGGSYRQLMAMPPINWEMKGRFSGESKVTLPAKYDTYFQRAPERDR